MSTLLEKFIAPADTAETEISTQRAQSTDIILTAILFISLLLIHGVMTAAVKEPVNFGVEQTQLLVAEILVYK